VGGGGPQIILRWGKGTSGNCEVGEVGPQGIVRWGEVGPQGIMRCDLRELFVVTSGKCRHGGS